MDEDWALEIEREDDSVLAVGLGYSESIRINGVRISTYDCPDCLRYEEFDCELCMFFTPGDCRLRHDPFLMRETRTLFDIWRERRGVQLRRQRELIRAVHSELEAHGRPLHYAVLARMVADRHPKLQVSEIGVLRIMASHPNVFEKVARGVYRCTKSR